MQKAQDYYPDCPEAIIIGLARTGDRRAYSELVRRRQSQVRNLMRRFSNDTTLADDLAQQVFLKVWIGIRKLRKPGAFGGWLNRLAINVWLQHLRKNDALRNSDALAGTENAHRDTSDVGMDLDSALATLPDPERLCVVLSYNEGMSHMEIAELTKLPLGTVKSHIRRGGQQLKQLLSAYMEQATTEA